MRYLVDANVLSELTKPSPAARVLDWLRRHEPDLVVDPGMRWADLLARLRTAGKSMPIKDSLIAATALLLGLTIVTRNVADFSAAGVTVIDPFVD